MTALQDLLAAPIVVVTQRPKMLSQRAEYDLHAPDGQPLGELHYVVSDASGTPVLVLEKPGSWGRQHFVVLDSRGVQLGEVQQESMFFAPQFDLRASDGSTGRLDGGRMMSWEWTIEGPG